MNRTAAFVAVAFALSCGDHRRDLGGSAIELSGEDGLPALRAFPRTEPRRTGSSIAIHESTVWVADETNKMLRSGALDMAPQLSASLPLPGPPAQIVFAGDRMLVTIRDPGMLVIADARGTILHRVNLPYDAWGIAIDEEEKTAIVTSAWSNAVSVVDLESHAVRATLDVAREPRGVVVSKGRAYVSHLTSATITRIDLSTFLARIVDLPPAPLRDGEKGSLEASLGYSLAASGDRLFAARHALGAMGIDAWFGTATVDVLLTEDDSPLITARADKQKSAIQRNAFAEGRVGEHLVNARKPLLVADAPFVQPRDMMVTGGDLWVLGEGNATIARLDARAVAPSVQVREKIALGRECVGPTGFVIAPDGSMLVSCAASFSIARVVSGGSTIETYAVDPLSELAAKGRRMFVDAGDLRVSGGLGCAGCHPEGRDDGHVWHLVDTKDAGVIQPNDVPKQALVGTASVVKAGGLARQTPMLAGRVSHAGPFGWNGQSKTLEARVEEGTHLHRWHDPFVPEPQLREIAKALSAFLRTGLVVPKSSRPLTAVEQRGKTLFESRETQCASCHDGGGTDGEVHRVQLEYPTSGFDYEPGVAFKTPSLRFVSHTAPYFHDGSAKRFDDVLRVTDDGRMGHTSHLSEEDKRALVAYLETL